MGDLSDAAVVYLVTVFNTTFSQLFILLGPGLLLALIMNLLSGFVRSRASEVLGYKFFIYFTAIGTVVHELGHALFAIIFGHRITQMSLFSPQSDDSLGRVEHSYNPSSIYQNIGKFFIGIGPIILGSIVIYFAAKFTVGNQIFQPLTSVHISPDTFNSWGNVWAFCLEVYWNALQVMAQLFSPGNFRNIGFIPFLYIVFAVGTHVKLSPPDLRGAWSGFAFLFGLFFMFNLFTIWFGSFVTKYITLLSQSYIFFYACMLFAIVLLLIFLLIISGISMVKRVSIR